jgi:hypothetical protein
MRASVKKKMTTLRWMVKGGKRHAGQQEDLILRGQLEKKRVTPSPTLAHLGLKRKINLAPPTLDILVSFNVARCKTDFQVMGRNITGSVFVFGSC